MKGIIFAAGIGSRLKPFTDHHPKALVDIGGQPMLGRVIDRMVMSGINDIVINIHHHGEQIIEYLSTLSHLSCRLHISDERDCLLDTGGGILKAAKWLDGNEPVIAHNADILSDIDLNHLCQTLLDDRADATLAIQPSRHSSRLLYFNSNHRLVGWCNNSTGATRPEGFKVEGFNSAAFSGIHIFRPDRVLPLLERYSQLVGNIFSVIPFYLEMIGQLNISGMEVDSTVRWHDVGRPETLERARLDLARD